MSEQFTKSFVSVTLIYTHWQVYDQTPTYKRACALSTNKVVIHKRIWRIRDSYKGIMRVSLFIVFLCTMFPVYAGIHPVDFKHSVTVHSPENQKGLEVCLSAATGKVAVTAFNEVELDTIGDSRNYDVLSADFAWQYRALDVRGEIANSYKVNVLMNVAGQSLSYC